MSDYRVASRYAKSLLQLAVEQGKEEAIASDMALFGSVCEQNHDFRLLLRNPIVKHDKKLKILKSIFSGKVDPMTIAIFELITRKNREAILPAVAQEFHRQFNLLRGIVEASVSTTFELDPELRKEFTQIVEKISGRKPELEEQVDPDLVGGFILRIEDKQIDESIKSKLQTLSLKFKSKEGLKQITG